MIAARIGQPGLAVGMPMPASSSKGGVGVDIDAVGTTDSLLVVACAGGVGLTNGLKSSGPAEVCLVEYQYWINC